MFTRLESLRGLAAVMVVLYHSPFRFGSASTELVTNSYLFVDLFFVLSGFVMAYAYSDKIRDGMGFLQYITLRLGRLYPLHLFTLFLWIPYILFKQYLYHSGFGGTDQFDENNLSTLASNLLLIHAMGVHETLSWNHPSWSISSEFFAYVLFFALTVTIDRARSLALPLLVCVLSYGFIFLVVQPEGLRVTYDYGFVRCIAAFYLGVFLFRLRGFLSPDKLSATAISILEVTAIAAVLVSVIYSGSGWLMLVLTIASFGLTVFVFAAQGGGLVSRILDLNLVRKIGIWSFSIYMMHRLIQFGVSNVFEFILGIDPKGPLGWWSVALNIALLALIIVCSRCSYEWVEKPCRDWVKSKVQRPALGDLNPSQ